jgi:type IV secretion system protein VirB10
MIHVRFHSRARRFALALLAAPMAVAPMLATPAHAQWVVFDPSNYAQNVLTAARSLQQITNQITSLQNQTQMLINQARNLASLPTSSLNQIEQSLQRTQTLLAQPSTPSAQDRQLAFLNQTPDKRTVSPDRVAAPTSANMLQAGAVIPAALITGIRSDLPGQITAQVTENIYDSPTGKILLIPQGARVIGQYDNGVGFGQRRILLVWNRLIFPNGRSIVLERQPGADAEGYAGLEDGVDDHWGDLFKAAVLSTILSVGAEAGTSQNENNLVQAIRSGASTGISQTGEQIVSRQLNIAPTLTIRPGFPVRVIATRDLVLEAYGG